MERFIACVLALGCAWVGRANADTITLESFSRPPALATLRVRIERPPVPLVGLSVEVEKLFVDVESVLGRNAMTTNWQFAIPDVPWITITIATGMRTLVLRSSHPHFEQNADMVATAHGIVALGGATRDAVLAKQPEEFRRGRRTFDEVLRVLKAYLDREVLVIPPRT